jgi:hypothetical protein
MAYTTINKSDDYFTTQTYSGNSFDGRELLNFGFAPDMAWVKRRDAARSNFIADIVRGGNKQLKTNLTGAETTYTGYIQSFLSDGFSLGADGDSNATGGTYVSWAWKGGGASSANTDGSISSTVSANTTSGFSVAKYTGTGANASFGHGLGTTPAVYILKSLTGVSTWLMYHQSLGIGYHLGLNNTSANAANDASFANNTAPDASKIYLGNWGDLNANGSDFICYSFAEKKGYSKFGIYEGNGNADGTFVYTGFKPAFVMVKRTDSTSDWLMCDSGRNVSNVVNKKLFANLSQAEDSYDSFDFVSNGFKIRSSGTGHNASGANMIYMAFAEAPLVGTNNIPATAR